MEKNKPSRGVVIFGWIMIIINILVFLTVFNYKSSFDAYKSFPKNLIIAIVVYTIFSAIIGIIAGIGILKLKELMRKIVIFINSLDVLVSVPVFFLWRQRFATILLYTGSNIFSSWCPTKFN